MSNVFKTYWDLRMKSAQQRLEAALHLIRHKGTRGTLAENVVRDVIDSFLPQRWASSTGFVVDKNSQASRQVDVLLFDQLNNAPLYRDESVTVLTAGTGPIGIEIKSNLDKKALKDSLLNIEAMRQVDPTARTSVFAYQGLGPTALRRHLRDSVEGTNGWRRIVPEDLPDMICIMAERIVVRRPDAGPTAPALEAFRSADPVIWSLLTRVLNDLRVASLVPLLPEPTMAEKLYTIP